MRRIILILCPLIILASSFSMRKVDATGDEARIRTLFSGKIEKWDVEFMKDEGTFEGYLMNDVNRWTFEVGKLTGEVNTEFNDALGSWVLTSGTKEYKLKTWITGSWYKWELSGEDIPGKTTIQTLYNNSWDNWAMKRDSIDVSITTYLYNSWDDWRISGNLKKMTDGEKIASMFIPVFVSRVYKRGLVK